MTMRIIIQFILLAVLGWSGGGTAALRADDIDQALRLIQQADGAFRVTSESDIAAAKAELSLQTRLLGEVLAASPVHGPSWKEFLRWDRLAAQVADNATPDLEELSAILDRFTRDHDGLELPAILRVRTALIRYYHRCLSSGNQQLPQQYQQRLGELAQLVESMRGDKTAEPLEKIALQLEWFDRYEQIPSVIAAVRQSAPLANLYVFVSDEFITKATQEQVDRVDPLTDCVLGTTIHGTSHLTGTMAAFPIGSEGGIKLQARLQGDAATSGRGYNGPVRADMVGEASVQVRGEILFGPEGFRVGHTLAHVSATGRPTSMWTTCNSRLVSGVVTCAARRRAAKTQELGDCIASRHAEQKLQVQVAGELQTRLDELQQAYLTRFRHPLLRHQMFPQTFRASSSDRGAQLEMLLATSCQLGAPQPPPVAAGKGALAVQLHESAIGNLAASLLAGRTLSELEVRDMLHEIFGAKSLAPPHNNETDNEVALNEEDVLYITFADERPVTCRVDDSVVTLHLRASHYIVNRRKVAPMNVTLRYRLQQSAAGVVASQVAEPEITPPRFEVDGAGRLGTREITARKLISNMLRRELAETYNLEAFVLPQPADAFGKLVVTQLIADNSWLVVGAERVAATGASP